MTFEIPNLPASATALQTAESTLFSCDWQAALAGVKGNGVLSGCGLSESGTPDMNVVVASGVVRIDGVNYAVTGGNAAVGSNASGNPRIDLISVDDNDTITVTAGTAAATPDAPEIPSGGILLGLVYVANGETGLADAEIFNRQVIVENPYAGADGIKFADPTLQSWTNINHGSGTYTKDATNGVMSIKEDGDGAFKVRGWSMTAPVSTPYTVTAYIRLNLQAANNNGWAFGFREESSGELVILQRMYSAGIGFIVGKWNSPTSISAGYDSLVYPLLDTPWVRITDNGTNLIWEVSVTGRTWMTINTKARTDWLTPDRIFIGALLNTASGLDVPIDILSLAIG